MRQLASVTYVIWHEGYAIFYWDFFIYPLSLSDEFDLHLHEYAFYNLFAAYVFLIEMWISIFL